MKTLDPVFNTATFQTTITLYDDTTELPFNLSGVSTITVKIRDIDTEATELDGSLSGGEIVIVGASVDGTIKVTFTADQMSRLAAPKTYELGIVVTTTAPVFVSQAILARIPVLQGL